MRCPACTTVVALEARAQEEHLRTHHCARCSGLWLRNDDYLQWMRHIEFVPGPDPDAVRGLAPPQAQGAVREAGLRSCPDCGYVLARYRLGYGIHFVVDHCRQCAGTWFDAGEWDSLRAAGLHDDLLHVITDEWQQALRDQERRERLDAEFRGRVGDADYVRLIEVKRWLDAHRRRPEMLAFLQSRPTPTPHAPE
jgi:Zn-finger nucleic acid-binding protein